MCLQQSHQLKGRVRPHIIFGARYYSSQTNFAILSIHGDFVHKSDQGCITTTLS